MRTIPLLIVTLLAAFTQAANIKENVQTVSSAMTLTTATDLHITTGSPFTEAGSMNLVHPDCVLIIDSLKPSIVKEKWLSHILINGQQAEHDVNCRIAICDNGTIVYPHPNTGFMPLTVFSERNFGGANCSDFVLTKYYKGLGDMTNNIRSLKLKRGYMATLACNTDGTGYSRVFIAQDADLEVADLGFNLNGRIAFLRVFPWRKVTKKGLGGTKAYNHLFNATWSWNWGANNLEYDDEEYIPSHEQEAWPSWTSIMAIDKSNHLLGHCEPDNKNGEHITVAQIEDKLFKTGSWQRMYQTGMRVGSPAPGGGDDGDQKWLDEFMRCCKEYNCRIDFVQVHKYWYASGSQFNTDMNNWYNRYKRPVWITEWNYGGNWTTETWPDADRSGTPKNYAHALAGIKDICTTFENNTHVERYSIYNWVQDCRKIYNENDSTLKDKNYLTPAGEYYAALNSKTAYTGGEGYVMEWLYKAPTDLTLTYTRSTRKVSLVWNCQNGKQTDSVWVERKLDGVDSGFVVIATYGMSEQSEFTYTDEGVADYSGLVTYRIHNYDSDGKQRYSLEESVMMARSTGDETLQYGQLKLTNTNLITIDFCTPFDSIPAVFMSLPTRKNGKVVLGSVISIVNRRYFSYMPFPWQFQTGGSTELVQTESIDYAALPYGHSQFGKMEMEVGSTQVKGDTTQVLFEHPFPEGVIPVVMTELKPTFRTVPIVTRIWDVTSTGFKVTLICEAGAATTIKTKQLMSYLAITPGTALYNEELSISAGIGPEPIYGLAAQKEYFVHASDGESADTLKLPNPIVLGSLQTYNTAVPTALCQFAMLTTTDDDGQTLTNGIRVKRIIDTGSKATLDLAHADTFGWVAISKTSVASGISLAVSHPVPSSPQVVYNLQGCRMSSSQLKRGLYIVGGKKTILR